jgi:hypothetical protein
MTIDSIGDPIRGFPRLERYDAREPNGLRIARIVITSRALLNRLASVHADARRYHSQPAIFEVADHEPKAVDRCIGRDSDFEATTAGGKDDARTQHDGNAW